MKRVRLAAAAAVLVGIALTGCGSVESPASPEEQANLRLATEWAQALIREQRFAEADKYMTPDYIQHNPIVQTGREGFLAFFSRPQGAAPTQIGTDSRRVIEFAKGPYVVWVNESLAIDQNGAPYRFNWFDILRVENGKIAEHWDNFIREVPAPGEPPPEPVVQGIGPKPVRPDNTNAEQRNEAIANVLLKDILQYGHVELAEQVMAADYTEHNPNRPAAGRNAFVDYFKERLMPEPIRAEWKDEPELVLASGNIVFYMFKRFSADPSNPAEIYKWNWFEVVRVENGLVQEHWDSAKRTPAPASVPKPAGFREYLE